MALFFLEYDLRKQRNYQPLYEELARFGAVRVLKSLWAFNRINTDATGLREHFRRFIDGDDGLVVMQVNDWATVRTERTPNELAA